jgi:hypothetical protein
VIPIAGREIKKGISPTNGLIIIQILGANLSTIADKKAKWLFNSADLSNLQIRAKAHFQLATRERFPGRS